SRLWSPSSGFRSLPGEPCPEAWSTEGALPGVASLMPGSLCADVEAERRGVARRGSKGGWADVSHGPAGVDAAASCPWAYAVATRARTLSSGRDRAAGRGCQPARGGAKKTGPGSTGPDDQRGAG